MNKAKFNDGFRPGAEVAVFWHHSFGRPSITKGTIHSVRKDGKFFLTGTNGGRSMKMWTPDKWGNAKASPSGERYARESIELWEDKHNEMVRESAEIKEAQANRTWLIDKINSLTAINADHRQLLKDLMVAVKIELEPTAETPE